MHSRLVRIALVLALATPLAAQSLLRAPQPSPHARAEQTFGITDVSIDYHRPAVANRRIWGGLVPYDVIWRAGANEPTLVTFSTPVTIEGQPLAAGTYSFYLIPSAQQWTAVFNRFTGGWGTYAYDPAEDALRVKVAAVPADPQERLGYTFDDVKDDGMTLNMRWEKLRVPVRIGADTKNLTLASMRTALRSGYHWRSSAYVEAASYALRNGDTDAALQYANRAMELSPDRPSLRVKAAVLEKKGDAAGAKELRDRAAAMQPEFAAINRGYALIGEKKFDEALKAANDLIARNPSFRAYALLGDVYSAKGDAPKAHEAYDKAMSMAADQSERTEVQDSINAAGAGG
jgi:tetratricopeptide (TPR) repeat protein